MCGANTICLTCKNMIVAETDDVEYRVCRFGIIAEILDCVKECTGYQSTETSPNVPQQWHG